MNADDQIATGIEREKWHIERAFRERELAIKEGELGLRRKEQAGSGWRNPLVVAILAATAAAAGHAVVAVVNGRLQRDLESEKFEHSYIIRLICTCCRRMLGPSTNPLQRAESPSLQSLLVSRSRIF